MQVEVLGEVRRFRILQKIDFNCDRKMMSILIEDLSTG